AGNPATQEKVKTTFLFKLADPASTWTVDLSSPPGAVHQGEVGKAACTLDISDADFMAMATGKADAMKLFSTGKLKICGNVMASQKLQALFKIDPSKAIEAVMKRRGVGTTPSAAAAASAAAPAAKSDPIAPKFFAALD